MYYGNAIHSKGGCMNTMVRGKTSIALLFMLLFFCKTNAQNIAVIGTGYVGLVTGAGLSHIGHTVVCADVDVKKTEQLQAGIIPIYEPGLAEIVQKNVDAGRLTFTTDVNAAIFDNDIIFIAVGTPMSDDGKADMKYVYSVVETIAHNINRHKIIVTKSTVPVKTGREIRDVLENQYHIPSDSFSLVSNPEFLREGSAVQDFLYPDRIVLGTDREEAFSVLSALYKPLQDRGARIIKTNLETSELIKYAANAFLALKITSMNQIANLCDAVGADANVLREGIGTDTRIGTAFLKQGPGYGGSCFPKDTQALVCIADQYNISLDVVKAVIRANEYQKTIPVTKLKELFFKKYGTEELKGKQIAIIGLAFKGNTDDVRYSPSITMIENLQKEGAIVLAYDPAAMDNMRQVFPEIRYTQTMYEAMIGADGIIIATEWDEFRDIDLAYVKAIVHDSILVDARNILDPKMMKQHEFVCDTIGQSYLCQ
jgi:UDPglucose 6-dehydrogenase